MNNNKIVIVLFIILFCGPIKAMVIGADGYPSALETSDSILLHDPISEQYKISGLLNHLENMLEKKSQQNVDQDVARSLLLVKTIHDYMKKNIGAQKILPRSCRSDLKHLKRGIEHIPDLPLPNNQTTQRYKSDICRYIDSLIMQCIDNK